jgi:hypothetical protein
MKRLILLALTLFTLSSARAQNAADLTQTVKGTLIDLDNDQPIPGALIGIVGTKLGAKSKLDGTFRIEGVPVGREQIKIQAFGYEPITQDLLISSGKQVVLDLRMKIKVLQGGEVVVRGSDDFKPINEEALVSSQTFSVDEVKRFAGSREDPARMAQTFAGVVGANEQRNDIIIRGGSPLELLWRLDGIDIPNPNHFATQGATGGPINAINVNLLNNSDFMTGAWPAEYGDKMSGVFDLRTRKGNSERYEYTAQMGFAGFEGMIEGPLFTNGSSFIASYRKSTLQILSAMGLDLGFAGVPKYDDLTIKTDIPLGDHDAFSLIGLGGRSTIDIEESKKDSVITGSFDITNGTDLGVLGASWKHIYSEHAVGTLSLSTVNQTYHTIVDSVTATPDYKFKNKDLFYTDDATEAFTSAKYSLNYSANASHLFSASLEGRIPRYELHEARTTTRDEPNAYKLDASGSTSEALGHVNWQWRPNDDLTFNTGVHFQYLDISKKSSVEPRFGAQWSFTEDQSLNVGFGVHRQSQPMVVYFGNPANRSLDFTQSIHYILGYSNRIDEDLLLKLEAYYKDISHAPIERDKASAFSYLNAGSNFGGVSTNKALVSNGLGKSYGVELTLMKHFSNNYYLTATTSLFRQRFTGSDGKWYDGAFDNKYIVNLLAGYDWKISPTFSIEMSSKLTFAGGAPYTPIDTAKARMFNVSGEFGPQYFEDGRAFSERYPFYKRVDLKVEFRKNLGSFAIVGFMTAENALNFKNVLIYTYDPVTQSVIPINQLGIFPYGGFRIEF